MTSNSQAEHTIHRGQENSASYHLLLQKYWTLFRIYEREFGPAPVPTVEELKHRLSPHPTCFHTGLFAVHFPSLKKCRDLTHIRQSAIITGLGKFKCCDWELIYALEKIGYYFQIQDFTYWRNLLVQGRFEEAITIEHLVKQLRPDTDFRGPKESSLCPFELSQVIKMLTAIILTNDSLESDNPLWKDETVHDLPIEVDRQYLYPQI